jgi:hypothetical protein
MYHHTGWATRKPHRFVSQVEQCEGRCLLSSFAELEPNNSFAAYQPLNNDTSYSVSGAISALSDLDYYAFYALKGSTISLNCRASVTTGNRSTEFDPTIGLFNPSGNLVGSNDDSGTGSIWAAALSTTTNQSGIWRVAVSHYNDFTFTEGNSRPSYDPDNDNSGPGVHTGSYVLTISGAQKPEIRVYDINDPTEVDATNPTKFRIDANADMPRIPLKVVGITPAPNTQASYVWNKSIQLSQTDAPLATTAGYVKTDFNPETVVGSENYMPNFQGLTRGGNLSLVVKTTVAGLNLEAKRDDRTNPTNPFKIIGTKPGAADVVAFINGLGTPGLAAGATHNFGRIVQAIIKHESGGNSSLVNQFNANGFPTFNSNADGTSGDGGAGLMQLSLSKVTQENRWNWKQNIRDGFNLLAGNLEQANRHIRNARNAVTAQQLAALAQANGVSGVTFAIPTAEQLLLNAISLFGPNSRYYHSYRLNNSYVVTRNPGGTGTINLNVVPNGYVDTIIGLY